MEIKIINNCVEDITVNLHLVEWNTVNRSFRAVIIINKKPIKTFTLFGGYKNCYTWKSNVKIEDYYNLENWAIYVGGGLLLSSFTGQYSEIIQRNLPKLLIQILNWSKDIVKYNMATEG